jgi:hypothetical protein
VSPAEYENQLPERLVEETARFALARLSICVAPGDEFERIAELGERLIYVVRRNRELVVCEDVLEAHHSVLAAGEPVFAAGELSLAVHGEHKIVLDLNELSGHYRPARDCRRVAAEVLSSLDFFVPDDLLDS